MSSAEAIEHMNGFRRKSRQVLAGGFVGSLAAVGLTLYLFGVFQDAMVAAFGTSVSVFAWASPVFIAISGVLSPFVGRSLATRGRPGWSIRSVMMTGAAGIGVGLVLVSRAESLSTAALAYALLVAPGTVLLGPLLGQAMVTNWFEASRGRALGIVSAGTTVGGVLVPPLAALLIDVLGWRDALAVLGLLSLGVALPAVAMLVTTSPEDVGLHPDGLEIRTLTPSDGKPTPPRSASALLRSPDLWITGVIFGLLFCAGTISTVFTIPYATELGLPLVGGALIVSMRAGSAAIGKIVLGSLADRYGIRLVLYGIVVVEIVLMGLLIQTRQPTLFIILGVGLGFVGGAALPLKAALTGQLFGREAFGSAMGLLSPIGVPFQLFMLPFAGYVYDRFGSYAYVFGCTLPLFLLAGLLIGFVKLPDRS